MAATVGADASLATSIAILLYVNSVRNGYAFDDHRAIERNPCVAAAVDCDWSTLLGSDFWGTPLASPRSHHSYRPLAVLSLALDVRRSGPGSVHATNALLHGVCTSLVWRLCADALGGRALPLAAALLHAVHPVNSEAVAYGVGRADLLAAGFGLAGMVCHGRASSAAAFRCLGRSEPSDEHAGEERRARSYGGMATVVALRLAAAVCFVLALAAKETALVLLPACVVQDALRVLCPPSSKASGSRRMGEHEPETQRARADSEAHEHEPAPLSRWQMTRALTPGIVLLGLLAAGYVVLRVHVIGPLASHFRRLDNPIPSLGSAVDRALATARVHLQCALILTWPSVLSADYSHDALGLSPEALMASRLTLTAAALALYAACVGVALRLLWCMCQRATPVLARRRARACLGWLALLVLAYAPASHVWVALSFVVAERLLYVPCAALCLLTVVALDTAVIATSGETRWLVRRLRRVLMAVLLIGGGARTVSRTLDWYDDATLFGAAAAAYPRSAKAVYQIADGLMQAGRTAEAVPLFHRALAIEPNYHYAYLHLATVALRQSDALAAAELAAASLRAVPSPNADGHALAARALLDLYRQTVRERSTHPTQATRPNAEGREDVEALARRAVEHARAAVATEPRVSQHAALLGDALGTTRRWAEAARAFEAASRLTPTDASLPIKEGAALLHVQRPDASRARFEHALRLAQELPASDPRVRDLVENARNGLALADKETPEDASGAYPRGRATAAERGRSFNG